MSSTLQSQIGWKKEKLWRKGTNELGSGLQWKAFLKVNLTLNYLFCARAARGSEGSWQRRGEEDGQRASTSHAAGWRAGKSQAIILTAQREQETDRSHTHACTSNGDKDQVRIYTDSTAVAVYTHRHTHCAGNKTANSSQGQRAAQESARQQLILPMWSLQRRREWCRRENSSILEKRERDVNRSMSLQQLLSPQSIYTTYMAYLWCMCASIFVCRRDFHGQFWTDHYLNLLHSNMCAENVSRTKRRKMNVWRDKGRQQNSHRRFL